MFDIKDIETENKQIWLKKMKEKDPRHAALFCGVCVRYIGAAGRCDCESVA